MRAEGLGIEKAIAEFLEHLVANGCSPHTVRSYRCDLGKIERFLAGGIGTIGKVRAGDLARFLNWQAAAVGPGGAKPSQGAQNRLRAVLRSLFGWLHKTGQISANPAACLRVHVYRPPAPELLTKTDWQRLLAVLKASDDANAERDRVIFELLAGTGIRAGAAARLAVRDVDLDTRSLRVLAKRGVVEQRLLSGKLAGTLKRYLEGKANGPVFPNGRGRHITSRHIQRRLEGWLKRSGLDKKVTPHTFRHTLATRLLEKTGNLQLVQRALGHRSIQSTLRYTQVPDRALRQALEAV